jgi:hypothetical protein
VPLTFMQPPEKKYANVLIVGPNGTGKSALAGSAPGHVFYVNGDTANAIDFVQKRHNQDGRIQYPRFEGVQTFSDLTRVACDPNPVNRPDTIVLDPIGEIHRQMMEMGSGMAIRPEIQVYGDVSVYIERFCRKMCKDGLTNFVVVAHDWPMKDDATGEVTLYPWTGTKNGTPTLGGALLQMFDIVAYTGVATQQMGENIAEGDFVCQLRHGRGRRGKDRFDTLAPFEKPDLADWFRRIGVHTTSVPAEQPKLAAVPPTTPDAKAEKPVPAPQEAKTTTNTTVKTGQRKRQTRDVMADAQKGANV